MSLYGSGLYGAGPFSGFPGAYGGGLYGAGMFGVGGNPGSLAALLAEPTLAASGSSVISAVGVFAISAPRSAMGTFVFQPSILAGQPGARLVVQLVGTNTNWNSNTTFTATASGGVSLAASQFVVNSFTSATWTLTLGTAGVGAITVNDGLVTEVLPTTIVPLSVRPPTAAGAARVTFNGTLTTATLSSPTALGTGAFAIITATGILAIAPPTSVGIGQGTFVFQPPILAGQPGARLVVQLIGTNTSWNNNTSWTATATGGVSLAASQFVVNSPISTTWTLTLGVAGVGTITVSDGLVTEILPTTIVPLMVRQPTAVGVATLKFFASGTIPAIPISAPQVSGFVGNLPAPTTLRVGVVAFQATGGVTGGSGITAAVNPVTVTGSATMTFVGAAAIGIQPVVFMGGFGGSTAPGSTFNVRPISGAGTGAVGNPPSQLSVHTVFTWIDPGLIEHQLSGLPDLDIIQGRTGLHMPTVKISEDSLPGSRGAGGAKLRDHIYESREVDLPLMLNCHDYATLWARHSEISSWFRLQRDTAGRPVPGRLRVMRPDGTERELTCVLGDTRVSAPSGIVAASRREYEGPVATITTARGYQLTGTPNHPVLTPQGWVALGSLAVGDCVISRRLGNRGGVRGDNTENRVPTIREVFESLTVASFIEARPTTKDDFHGDGQDSYIDVVRTNGQLLDGVKPAVAQPSGERSLSGAYHRESALVGNSAAFQHFGTLALSLAANAYSTESLNALACNSSQLSLRYGHNHAGAFQNLADSWASNTVTSANLNRGFTSEVASDHIVDFRLSSTATMLAYSTTHVYNLQTEDNTFLANNIVTHNCVYGGGLHGNEGSGVSGPTFRRMVLILKASDPLWYARNPTTMVFTLVAGATFFSPPFFPLHLGASTVATGAVAVNPGEEVCWPVWQIVGPGVNPVVTNLTTGQSLSLTLALTAGQSVTIDTRPTAKTVINDQTTLSLYSALAPGSATMWPLQPGSNNIQVLLSGASAASRLNLQFTPSFLGA